MKYQVGYFDSANRNRRILVKECPSEKEANTLEEELTNKGYHTFKRKRKCSTNDLKGGKDELL